MSILSPYCEFIPISTGRGEDGQTRDAEGWRVSLWSRHKSDEKCICPRDPQGVPIFLLIVIPSSQLPALFLFDSLLWTITIT